MNWSNFNAFLFRQKQNIVIILAIIVIIVLAAGRSIEKYFDKVVVDNVVVTPDRPVVTPVQPKVDFPPLVIKNGQIVDF